eukprot:8223088-Alexandrium_andersonii.AAC.1
MLQLQADCQAARTFEQWRGRGTWAQPAIRPQFVTVSGDILRAGNTPLIVHPTLTGTGGVRAGMQAPVEFVEEEGGCLLYTSPSPRD